MKYIIDVPDTQEITYYTEQKMVCLKVNEGIVASEIYIDAEPYTEPDRKAIEDEVWHLARTIESMSVGEIMNIFDVREENVPFLCNTRTYQEAKAKYEAWLKQKDETFDTGDEVYNKEIDSKGVILRRYNSDTLDILWDDGSAGETFAIKAITKTGRHFPEVAELLEKMRG